MISTPGDSWHHYLFKCICIVELSACSCAPLIEIYDQVHVPMMFQYKLQRIDLLYRKKMVSVDFTLLHFSLSQCLIFFISYILASAATGVCVKHTPGNGSLLPPYCPRCLRWSFPRLVWSDARWSFLPISMSAGIGDGAAFVPGDWGAAGSALPIEGGGPLLLN